MLFRSLVRPARSAARALVLAGLVGAAAAAVAQDQSRSFTVSAKKFAYDPAVIEVRQDDLVKITLKAEDIAHSFTIDDYRIAKRAAAGRSVTFEFRADKAGTFPFYCNLKADGGCRQMRGRLIVTPR